MSPGSKAEFVPYSGEELKQGDQLRLRDGSLAQVVRDNASRGLRVTIRAKERWAASAWQDAFTIERDQVREVWPAKFKAGDTVLIAHPRPAQASMAGRRATVVRQVNLPDPPTRRYGVRVFDDKRGWLGNGRTFEFSAEELEQAENADLPATPEWLRAGSTVTLKDGGEAWLLEEATPKAKTLKVARLPFRGSAHTELVVGWPEVVGTNPWQPQVGDPVELVDGETGRVSSVLSRNAPNVGVRSLEGDGYGSERIVKLEVVRRLAPGVAEPPELPVAPRTRSQRTPKSRPAVATTARWSPWRALTELAWPPAPPTVPPDRPLSSPAPATATVGTPMPPGDLAEMFSKVSYSRTLRRYQSLALDAFEASRGGGRRRAYLVLPPGAGKTVLGLEIARRLGNPTIAFGPNTAVQEQWVAQWAGFQPALAAASDQTDLNAPITALTYQALCNLESHPSQLDDQALHALHRVRQLPADVEPDPRDEAELGAVRARLRRSIAASGDRESLFALLHPNGRRLVETVRNSGRQWTIVLDECHHLLDMWGRLVLALATELGDNVFLVGLTATPPGEMDGIEAELYRQLFGRADYEVPTPAVVKEGSLAPYRDLCLLTTPLDSELRFIQQEGLRFQEFLTELMDPQLGSVSFPAWLNLRFVDRPGPDESQLPWSQIEHDDPELARAALRLAFAGQLQVPGGARLREEHRAAPTVDDWVALIDDWCRGHLRRSRDTADLNAWEKVRRMLPGVGWVLTREGIRPHVSPVDRLLLLSSSKVAAAIDVLQAELNDLGAGLRAILVCDFEQASAEYHPELNGVLDPAAGSAGLILQHLLAAPTTNALGPILVTGRSLAMSGSTADAFLSWLEAVDPGLKARLHPPGSGDPDASVELTAGSTASASEYLPRVTEYFEAGRSRCLVGTRGLLAEGWDAPSVNVVIDLTGVGTSTTVHQMRGRSLRLDPEVPRKVGHNWDLVCVTDAHPKGVADYQRFVRKHSEYFSITPAGEIESGVSHVHPELSPSAPPPADRFAGLNAESLEAPASRPETYDLWRVGQPYSNSASQTVRIRVDRSAGLPAVAPLAPVPVERKSGAPPGVFLASGGLAGLAAVGIGVATGADVAGAAAALLTWGAGGYLTGRILRARMSGNASDSLLLRMGRAVAEALLDIGKLQSAEVTLLPQADGYYRCYLERGSYAESQLFAGSLDELLGPLDQPRYIIPRFTADVPRNSWQALVSGLRLAGGSSGTLVYHAVPSVLADNHDHAVSFGRAWNRQVSPGDPIHQSDARAQAILEVQRGESPLDVTTQMRVLWR